MFLIEYVKKLLSLILRDRLRYEAVDSSDSDNIMRRETESPLGRPETGSQGVVCRRVMLLCLSCISLVGLGGFIYNPGVVYGVVYGAPLIVKYSCGNNPTEARESGCFFDPMMSAWIPDQCYFSDLAEEYGDIFLTWNWYWDRNHTMAITAADELAQIRAGNYTKIWTDYHHAHDLHCIYTWRKMALTLERNLLRLDARSLEFDHSRHCAMAISDILDGKDPMEGSLYVTIWPMMYHDCLPIEKQFA